MKTEAKRLIEVFPSAPQPVRKALGNRDLVEEQIGCSDTRVFRAIDRSGTFYLKTQSVPAFNSFAREVQILDWLLGKLPVPEVIEFVQGSENEYLLLSEVPGINCVEAMELLDHRRIVQLLAEGLHMIHSLEISDCPFDEGILQKLSNAEQNIRHDLIDEDDFDEERRGWTSRQVLDLLRKEPPPESDLVFNHGDYCLPNILIQDDRISGFIDLGRAGVSDRYNDLAIASRSIAYNLGATFESQFFQVFGIDQVDAEKIAYYRLMDELF